MKYVITTHMPCTAAEYTLLKDDVEYKDFQVRHGQAEQQPRLSTRVIFLFAADFLSPPLRSERQDVLVLKGGRPPGWSSILPPLASWRAPLRSPPPPVAYSIPALHLVTRTDNLSTPPTKTTQHTHTHTSITPPTHKSPSLRRLVRRR
jgi:hypothetical protein